MFALVAVNGSRAAAHSARVTSQAGTRTPTVPVPPVTSTASVSGARTTSVSGPGQKARANRAPSVGNTPIDASTCAMSAATSGMAFSRSRRLIVKSLLMAVTSKGFAARP